MTGKTCGIGSVAVLAACATMAQAGRAEAQDYEWAAIAQAEGGVEGGGQGYASGVRQARTTLRLGAELGIPDTPRTLWSSALVVELEPRSSLGLDLRYGRLVSNHLMFFGGAQAILAPITLYGLVFGAEGRIPFGKSLSLTVGPTFKVFFLGDDLPSGIVIWQALFQAGFHVNLL
jgi:hypothetical protein